MSIMEKLFGSMSAQQPAQQPAQPPGATPPGAMPANAGATDPNNPQIPPQNPQATQTTANEPASPLANFADLWKPNETQGEATDTSFLGAVDPQKVMEAASKQDFTRIASQEQLAKINAGGPEAMQTMFELMNKITQTAFAQSTMTSAKLIEKALGTAQNRFNADLPNAVKRLNVSETLRGENPIFSNPAVAPIIEALQVQLTQKFPQASTAEIAKMARDYVSEFGNAVVPKQETVDKSKVSKEQDWSGFLN